MARRRYPLEPFLQGHLDGLCGLYAIINGIRLALGPDRELSDAVWLDLFGGMLREVSRRYSRDDLTASGLEPKHLMTALRHALRTMGREQGIRLTSHRPFVKAGRPRFTAVLKGLRRYQQLPNTSIILGIGGPLDHWTVIKWIGTHYIGFFDSCGSYGMRIDRCRMAYEPARRLTTEHVLYTGGLSIIHAGSSSDESAANSRGPHSC
jgi:hypothetical protein